MVDLRYHLRMRALCILTVTLLTAMASANPRTLPFEIVTVLPDTHQVLVLDNPAADVAAQPVVDPREVSPWVVDAVGDTARC